MKKLIPLYFFLEIGFSISALAQNTDFRLVGTAYGRGDGYGSIYSVNPDGSGFIKIKSFTEPTGDNINFLTKGTDGFVYGTMSRGGKGYGTMFRINSDGTGFTKIYDFTGKNSSSGPVGNLCMASNGILYGSAYGSGSGTSKAALYSIHTDGSSFKKLLDYSPSGLSYPPVGGVIQCSDGNLYGISQFGAAVGTGGIVFKISPDGTGFTKIYNVGGTSASIQTTSDPIEASDGDLIIITSTKFLKMHKDGTNVTTIISTYGGYSNFINGNDGYYYGYKTNGEILKLKSDGLSVTTISSQLQGHSQGNLVLGSDGALYGGGGVAPGYLFKINRDGSGFQQLNSISGSSIIESQNGTFIGLGAGYEIFKMSGNIVSSIRVHDTEPQYPRSEPIVGADGDLYGITEWGGIIDANASNGYGTFYKLHTDGTGFAKLIDFNGTNGSNPGMPFVQLANGDFIGTTILGGSANGGTIFKYSDGGGLVKYMDFPLLNGYMQEPQGLMPASDGYLYGMTEYGGSSNNGNLFKIKPDGTGFSQIYQFSGSDGQTPECLYLTQLSDGLLYGTTGFGGSNNKGVIFKVSTSGTGMVKLWDFDGANSGSFPKTSLTYASNGYLYGMTSSGGSVNAGVAFRIKPDGTGFQKLIDFDGGLNGLSPYRSPLKEAPDGFLYGTTEFGGAQNLGTLFKIKLDGSAFTKIHDFDSLNGGQIVGGVTIVNSTTHKFSQTITFGSLSNKIASDPSFTLSATTDSGLPITYTSSNPQVATISGNTVTITGGGTTTITASQSGNSSFLSAANVPQTLVINKLSQTITFGNLADKLSIDPAFTLGGTTSSSLPITYSSSNTQVATLSGNSVTIKGAGTTTITASQPGSSVFLPAADVNQTLTVKLVTGDLNPFDVEDVVIYPNPATSNLIIGLKGFSMSEPVNVSIYDLTGKMHDTRGVSDEASVTIGVRDYVKGMYFVKVIYKGTVYTRKFVKE